MTRAPIYVQIDKETDVLELIDSLKQNLIRAKKVLHDLYAVRTEENKQIREIQYRIQEMQERLKRLDEEVLQ